MLTIKFQDHNIETFGKTFVPDGEDGRWPVLLTCAAGVVV